MVFSCSHISFRRWSTLSHSSRVGVSYCCSCLLLLWVFIQLCRFSHLFNFLSLLCAFLVQYGEHQHSGNVKNQKKKKLSLLTITATSKHLELAYIDRLFYLFCPSFYWHEAVECISPLRPKALTPSSSLKATLTRT